MIFSWDSLHGHPEFGEVEVIFTISTFPIDGFVILVFGGIFSISIINDSDKLNGFVTQEKTHTHSSKSENKKEKISSEKRGGKK